MSWYQLYAIDLFFIALFLLSYYRNCYRKGYRFDLWHGYLFMNFLLPNMLMLPFANSELNAVVVGRDIDGILTVLPTVFLITMVGYVAVLLGGGLWRIHLGLGLKQKVNSTLMVLPRLSLLMMKSRSVLVFETTICLMLQASALAYYFTQSGFGFDMRGYTFENPALRPLALIVSNFSVLVGSHCFARYLQKKERILLLCTLLLTLGLFFFGSRGNLLAIFLSAGMCYLVQLRSRVSLFRLFAVVIVLVLIGFYLGNVRAGQYGLGELFAMLVVLLFYGNNFSDLRDFAWVYAGWDHTWWLGKTYLAGLLSMVPRFVSQFRDTWGAGVAMDLTVGLDPTVHPGLRPGMFGEAFFNFGWPGAIVVGLVAGIVLRRVDRDVKSALRPENPSMMRAFASTQMLNLIGAVAISSSLSSLYVICAVYLFSWLCLKVQAMLVIKHAALPQH